MRSAIIIGTGGHSRVIFSIIKRCKTHEIKVFVDLNEDPIDDQMLGIPICGYKDFTRYVNDYELPDFYLAIGNNALRKKWWQALQDYGYLLPNLISPDCVVDSSAQLGLGNIICAQSFIGPFAKLGNNILVNTGAVIDHESKISSNCHLAPNSTICGRVKIEEDCFIGAGATIIDRINVHSKIVVGAGATVINDLIQEGTYVGTPAKRIADL